MEAPLRGYEKYGNIKVHRSRGTFFIPSLEHTGELYEISGSRTLILAGEIDPREIVENLKALCLEFY